MEKTKWVQHISGQGEKWEVENSEHNYPHLWRAKDHQGRVKILDACVWIPKSEYILCDPPEQWEKVEVGIRGSQSGVLYLKDAPHVLHIAKLGEGFRWAYSGDGVIVERRKS